MVVNENNIMANFQSNGTRMQTVTSVNRRLDRTKIGTAIRIRIEKNSI